MEKCDDTVSEKICKERRGTCDISDMRTDIKDLRSSIADINTKVGKIDTSLDFVINDLRKENKNEIVRYVLISFCLMTAVVYYLITGNIPNSGI